jgi:cold shock CspA family protein
MRQVPEETSRCAREGTRQNRALRPFKLSSVPRCKRLRKKERREVMAEMLLGRVWSIRWDRGFGFIRSDTGSDYFLSQSDIGLPPVGTRVTFEPYQAAKGWRAKNVTKVN